MRVLVVLWAPALAAQQVELISRSDQTQAPANGLSHIPQVSDDGRFVLFESAATNVVVGQVDANGSTDLFLRDRQLGTTTLVSHIPSSPTTTGNMFSYTSVLSADGNYVAFRSPATDLVSGVTDLNGTDDVFLFERATGTVTLVSHTSSPTTTPNYFSTSPSISGDGSYVVFASLATDVGPVTVDANGTDTDIFLFERATGAITLVSHAAFSTTTTGNSGTFSGVISKDGDWVGLLGTATSLVAGMTDGNGTGTDVFLYSRTTGAIALVSHTSLATTSGNGTCDRVVISDDGAYLAFESEATNLGPGFSDANGFRDVFFFERATGAISLVSHSAPTTTGNGMSMFPGISGDGNFVAFGTMATDLGGAGTFTDTNTGFDEFLWERASGTLSLMSHTTSTTMAGATGSAFPGNSSLDTTGAHVAFASFAGDLGSGLTDTNGGPDVFVYERASGALSLASHVAGSPTTTGNGHSQPGRITPDGGHVVFASDSSDLVSGDANGSTDSFAYSDCASTLTATPAGNNRIDLSWSAGTGPFAVRRSLTPGGPYTTLASISGTSFSDLTAQGGLTYYYVVENICGPSNEASAMTTGACTLPPDFAGVTSATSGGGSCQVTVGWSPATSPCGGSVSYSVYRSTTSGFTPDASTRLVSGLAATSYLDTAAVLPLTTYYYVVRAVADVNGAEDSNTVQVSNTPTSCVPTPSPKVPVLDVRSGDTQNEVLWVNPTGIGPSGLQTWVNYTADGSSPSCPGTGGSTLALSGSPFGGTAGARGAATHSSLANGTTYKYAACVDDGVAATSAASYSAGRPDSVSGNFKWAYTTAASALSSAGISPDVSYQLVSNDRILHGLQPAAGGGSWLAAPWMPPLTNAPVPGRPGVVTFPSTTVGGASRIVLLASQDGHVYCLNADTGQPLWVSPLLGDSLQAAPSGIFADFGGAYDLVLLGSRTPSGDSKFYALNLSNGTVAWSFDNLGGASGIGIISATAQVDIPNRRVYFTSRQKAGGSSDTVWALSFTATTATKLWSADIGDVDGAPVLRSGKIYVGNNAGEVRVLNALSGAPVWATPYATGDGVVKGLVWVDAATSRLYFSTNGQVHAVTDTGASGVAFWSTPVSVPNPSPVMLIGGRVYVGGGASKLYSIDASSATPAAPTSVTVGDPLVPKIVGSLAYDTRNGLFVVGTDLGVFYAVLGPF